MLRSMYVVARQYAPDKIRCNVILLGMMDTPHIRTLHSDRSQEEIEQLMRMRDSYCPLGHMGTAWGATAHSPADGRIASIYGPAPSTT